ncbi:alpha/beta fold hydrolase [Massilia sp. TN1-12]|uniref:alpha/beta fold hydrolase n=1 Tax=Massilia paldalensis TaxID=3377675 RepID=UPI0038514314
MKCTKPRIAALLIAVLCIGQDVGKESRAAEPAPAPAATSRYAATIAPAERFEVDGVLVERHGSRGRPLILVPGLASGSWVWQDTIRAFAGEYTLYVLTLPGFDGRPAAGEQPFAAAQAAVQKLIAQRRLDKPVVIGHSLGGILGFALAEDQPQLLGGVVSIDGLPVFPGTEDFPPQQRTQQAATMRQRLANIPAGAFAAQQQGYMRTIGVLDMDKADELAKLTGRSDPASVGRYTADVLALDLRPGLKSIAAPVLVLAPYFDLDSQQQGLTEAAKLDYYRALLEGVPRLQVTGVAPARHFAMFDQPDKVRDAIRAFLRGL